MGGSQMLSNAALGRIVPPTFASSSTTTMETMEKGKAPMTPEPPLGKGRKPIPPSLNPANPAQTYGSGIPGWMAPRPKSFHPPFVPTSMPKPPPDFPRSDKYSQLEASPHTSAPNGRPSTPIAGQDVKGAPASQFSGSEPTAVRSRSPSLQSINSDNSHLLNEPTFSKPKPKEDVSDYSCKPKPKDPVIHAKVKQLERKPSTKPNSYPRVKTTASFSSDSSCSLSELALLKENEGLSPVLIPDADEKSMAPQNDYASNNLSVRPVQDGRGKLLTILRGFSKQISIHTQGSASATQGVPNSLRQDVQAAYRRFRLEVHRTAPRFRPWEANFDPQGDVLRRMIEKVEVDDATGAKGAIMYVNDVMTAITRSRVDDPLGGVPFSVKESLVKEAIKGWKDLARDCATELLDLLFDHLNQVLTVSLGPKSASEALLRRIRDVLKEELEACRKAVEERIDFIYAAEEQIFTLNDQLYMEYRTKWLDRYGALLKQSREGGMAELLNRYATPEFQKEDSSYGWVPGVSKASATKTKIDSLIEEFAALGVQIKVSDLAKLFPADPMEPAIQLIAEVRAYFDVAYRRFGDAIPQQLHLTYLRGFDDRIDLAFSRFVMGLSPSECVDLLSLDPQPSRYGSN